MHNIVLDFDMVRRSVPAVGGVTIALWTPIVCLAVFMIAHVTVLLLRDVVVDKNSFELYAEIVEVCTHLFALFAILERNIEGLRGQIVLSTVISTVFHAVENFQSEQAAQPWHTLDRAAATGLIVSVFVKFLLHVHHSEVLLILSVGLACAFPWGNVLASSIVTLILLCVLLLSRKSMKNVQWLLKSVVYALSLGGTPSDPDTVTFTKEQGNLLTGALVLNLIAVAAYVVGESVGEWIEHWAHAVWHAFVYVTLWLVVKVLEESVGTPGSYDSLAQSFDRNDRVDFRASLPRSKTSRLNF